MPFIYFLSLTSIFYELGKLVVSFYPIQSIKLDNLKEKLKSENQTVVNGIIQDFQTILRRHKLSIS